MPVHEPRVTLQGLQVLHAFIEAGGKELSGADVVRLTGLLSGTLYPILIRFKHAGWLSDRWEDNDPIELGRPKKRFYRLTGAGQLAYRRNLPSGIGGELSWAR